MTCTRHHRLRICCSGIFPIDPKVRVSFHPRISIRLGAAFFIIPPVNVSGFVVIGCATIASRHLRLGLVAIIFAANMIIATVTVTINIVDAIIFVVFHIFLDLVAANMIIATVTINIVDAIIFVHRKIVVVLHIFLLVDTVTINIVMYFREITFSVLVWVEIDLCSLYVLG